MHFPPTYIFLFFLLSLASYYDIRHNEIPNQLNILILASSLLYVIVLSVLYIQFAIYSVYAFLLPYSLWRINLIGGADAKLLALACLIMTDPKVPSYALPPLFLSLSYVILFLAPNPRLLLKVAPWLALSTLFVLVFVSDLLPFFVLLSFFSLKVGELNIVGYSETLPLDDLQPHHMVREAIIGENVVEVSDADMFLRRGKFDYIPPFFLDEEDVEKIKQLWKERGKTEVKVARERPAVPAIPASFILYPVLFQ